MNVYKHIAFIEYILIFILIGAIFNLYVMVNNNSKMPVSCCGYEDNIHFNYNPYNNSVKYTILSDRYPIYGEILSVGDILMFLGLTITIMYFIIFLTYTLFKKVKK